MTKKLLMVILDSHFHGNDKMEGLDSHFHGNDKMEKLDSCFHGNDKMVIFTQ